MTMKSSIEYLVPDWPAPEWVHAASTTRNGGVSGGAWATFNLAQHVADDPAHVARNRRSLIEALHLPSQPVWLQQVHGVRVLDLSGDRSDTMADAGFSATPGVVCAVMTADCLPVLFTDTGGSAVAAAHAGWRGLVSGVLEATVAHFADPGEVMAWLGPAIGPQAFEVGAEVRDAFFAHHPQAVQAFRPNAAGRWLADIYALARQRLASVGVRRIYGGGLCTFSEADRFFSYRREHVTGRMASLIWMDEEMAGE
jgi:YfiH family protein